MEEKITGFGTFRYSDGRIDVGNWVDSRLEGFATTFLADGSLDKQGIWKDDEFLYFSEFPTQIASNNIREESSKTSDSLAQKERDLAILRGKTDALEAQLAELQGQQQAVSSDTQPPLLVVQSSLKNASTATIFGRVTDNVQVAEVTIDGEPVMINSDGSFSTEGYIPRAGREAEVIAYDLKGNQASQTLFLTREDTQEVQGPVFASLNPSGKRVQPNPNALALIIGVADYENTNARAIYADKDAQTFYDYALLKLGVPVILQTSKS